MTSDEAGRPSEAVLLERVLSIANEAMLTIDLQLRRFDTREPEDKLFPLRPWIDLQFLVIALRRLRRAAELGRKAPNVGATIAAAVDRFDQSVPNLVDMRDISEHFDAYVLGRGRVEGVSRKQLGVMKLDGRVFKYLGFSIDIDNARSAAAELLRNLRETSRLRSQE